MWNWSASMSGYSFARDQNLQLDSHGINHAIAVLLGQLFHVGLVFRTKARETDFGL
jgi:hypothetical protein